jgi:hypothetical protein
MRAGAALNLVKPYFFTAFLCPFLAFFPFFAFFAGFAFERAGGHPVTLTPIS